MKTEMVIQNPHASMPLRVPLFVECNTPEDVILANVIKNSRRIKKWVKIKPAHDRIAVICGGGPSLADTLDDIRNISGDIFALNGAASFLQQHNILPDYQIIMDAQPETSSLIGPAKEHLFASQVDPSLFDIVPDATLWHTTHGAMKVDEQDGFPEHDDDYCIVGAAVSVGNTALVLLYVLGYRTMHVFGMDSSHRNGKGHAYHQAMNDGDPCTVVTFLGKQYTCSLAMELQAKNFSLRADQLKAVGCKIEVHGDGLLPAMFRAPQEVLSEAKKYERMWDVADYRNLSPGELSTGRFIEIVKPEPKSSIIDFGCGTGRGAMRLNDLGYLVTMLDFASNCLDEAAKGITFVNADLTKPLNLYAKYGYCTDVMEHIPPEDVDAVIRNIMDSAATTYFQISTVPDNFGAVIGQSLHLTVRPHAWWRTKFEEFGYSIAFHEMQEICSSFLVKREGRA